MSLYSNTLFKYESWFLCKKSMNHGILDLK